MRDAEVRTAATSAEGSLAAARNGPPQSPHPWGGSCAEGPVPPCPREGAERQAAGSTGTRATAVAWGTAPRPRAGCSAGPQTPLHALGRAQGAQPPSQLSGPCRTTQGEPGRLTPCPRRSPHPHSRDPQLLR